MSSAANNYIVIHITINNVFGKISLAFIIRKENFHFTILIYRIEWNLKIHMKYQLRKTFLSIRNNKPAEELNISSEIIVDKLIKEIRWNTISSISLYYPIYNEVNVLGIVGFLRSINIKILLPVEDGFSIWSEDYDLKSNKWGAKEPSHKRLVTPDLVIVPIVCFDRNGYRIGYGSGFYDKMLCNIHISRKIGVAYSFQENYNIPYEPHDIKLELIVTEKEFITCI